MKADLDPAIERYLRAFEKLKHAIELVRILRWQKPAWTCLLCGHTNYATRCWNCGEPKELS